MYNVTVNFAHGVSHVLQYDYWCDVEQFMQWLDSGYVEMAQSQFAKYYAREGDAKPSLILNREYICSVVVEEVE